jgi:CysZ protein
MKDFFTGANYLFAGFGLLTKPGLKRFVIIPLVINFILFSLMFVILQHYTSQFASWITAQLPAWLHFISILIWLLFFLGFFFIFVYVFAALGAIVAAPFNGLLAEKVELYLTGKAPIDRGLIDNIKDMPRMVGRQLQILLYFLPRAMLILILFFIPVVHWLAIILWFLFCAWFLTLQYLDFPTDNHRIPLANVRDFLQMRRATTLGFGMSLMFVLSIPFLNFFAIPAAAAGATKFWIDENRRR